MICQTTVFQTWLQRDQPRVCRAVRLWYNGWQLLFVAAQKEEAVTKDRPLMKRTPLCNRENWPLEDPFWPWIRHWVSWTQFGVRTLAPQTISVLPAWIHLMCKRPLFFSPSSPRPPRCFVHLIWNNTYFIFCTKHVNKYICTCKYMCAYISHACIYTLLFLQINPTLHICHLNASHSMPGVQSFIQHVFPKSLLDARHCD